MHVTDVCLVFCKEPVWYEVGTHVGTLGKCATPTNVADGFYYVPFLQSLQALLNKPSIFNQVYRSTVHLWVLVILSSVYRLCQVHTKVLVTCYVIYVMELCVKIVKVICFKLLPTTMM